MTNKDRVLSLIGFAPSNDNAIDGELLDLGIAGAATYDVSQLVGVKTAAIRVMELLLTTADTSNENGSGFTNSIRFDRNAVLARINQLKNELGLVDTALPYITSRAVW